MASGSIKTHRKAVQPCYYKDYLTYITTQNASYTVPEDCYMRVSQTNTSGANAVTYLNGQELLVGSLFAPFIPLLKGDIVSTRASYGTYYIYIYSYRLP